MKGEIWKGWGGDEGEGYGRDGEEMKGEIWKGWGGWREGYRRNGEEMRRRGKEEVKRLPTNNMLYPLSMSKAHH